MHKLFEFIRSVYVVVLFIILEVAALSHYARSNSYTQARLLARSNQVVGGMQGTFTRMRHFWSLGEENRLLSERVIELEKELARYREAEHDLQLKQRLDSMHALYPYIYQTARVAVSTIHRTKNFIVINRGSNQGVEHDMALLTADGAMAGYIVTLSKNYAVALSILSPEFQASAKLKNDPSYYGAIRWDGSDSRYVTMHELPKYVDIHEGDEVVSTGFSDFFPAEIPIGTVESFYLNETKTYYTVRVRLAADMRTLSDVILARSVDYEELKGLEAKLRKLYQ